MSSLTKRTILAVGNVYVETQYIGLINSSVVLQVGREYRAPTWKMRLGGSAPNFAVQLRRLGEHVSLLGKVGNDEMGVKLIQLLEQEGIDTQLIQTVFDPNIQTSIDTGVILENGDNIQLVAGNANQSLCAQDISIELIAKKGVTHLYLGGFLKQPKLIEAYPLILAELKEKDISIFIDHGRIPVDLSREHKNSLITALQYAHCYFPNESELLSITGEHDINTALSAALEFGPEIVVVKRGKNGCVVKTKRETYSISGFTTKAVSSVGAGDAFNAGFIFAYTRGKHIYDCARFANGVAAFLVENNANPSLQDVAHLLA